MKSKPFVILAIITLLVIGGAFNYATVWAQGDVEIQEPFDSTKSEIWVEFSNYLDRQAVPGGGAINGLDPLQVLFTTPFDAIGVPYPRDDDNLDFGDAGEVDALANIRDALFGRLIANKADLLVSFLGDPDYNFPPINIPNVAVYIEHVAGNNPKWTQVSLNNPNTPSPQLEDLDGLQIWGFEGYANMYSLQGDAVTSVFYWNGAVPAAYVPLADIVAAVQSASLDPGHYVGSTSLIDLDGLMVLDGGTVGTWGSPDTIIFSIRNTIPGGGNWDGGEIVVLPFDGKPNSASYLNHGGHPWNTAFPVASTFHLDPPTEEVDAIEAYPPMTYGTPTLTQWGLITLVVLLIASTVFIVLRRKKAAVPA